MGWFSNKKDFDGQTDQDHLKSKDDRQHIIDAVKTTPGVTGQQVFSDWGDHDTDYSQSEHDRANGRASRRGQDGVGLPSTKEVQKFYDDSRPYPGLRIVKGNNDDTKKRRK